MKNIHTLQPDVLKARLGVETAFRLMWIQNQSFKITEERSGFSITLGGLGCSLGHPLFAGRAISCHSCSAGIPVDDREAIYLYNGSSVLVEQRGFMNGPPKMDLSISLSDLRCRECRDWALSCGTYVCPSCPSTVNYSKITLLSPVLRQSSGPKSNVTGSISEVFKEEIASYESWDR
jgi:hypothetical protein